MSDLDRRLAVVARRQHMLVTHTDVHAAGGSADDIRSRVKGGRWVRVDRGVYLLNGAPYPWEARQRAATLAAPLGAVASFFAAARLHGLSGFDHAGVELSIPRGTRYRRPGVRSHESTDLDRCRIVRRQGNDVTDPDRTILDLARFLRARRLEVVVEDARRKGLVTWQSLIRTLVAHARRGRPGIRRLRAVIVTHADREEITDTDVELLLLVSMRQAGLPEPVLHHRVLTPSGRFVAEVDIAYPQWKIAVEAVGDVHDRREVARKDRTRRNDLVLEGWLVLEFDNDRIRERPEAVIAEVRDAIAARSVAR